MGRLAGRVRRLAGRVGMHRVPACGVGPVRAVPLVVTPPALVVLERPAGRPWGERRRPARAGGPGRESRGGAGGPRGESRSGTRGPRGEGQAGAGRGFAALSDGGGGDLLESGGRGQNADEDASHLNECEMYGRDGAAGMVGTGLRSQLWVR